MLTVTGGDDNYKDRDEEQRVVTSLWARREVSSQCDEEYLDGRKSFTFSLDKENRGIPEEALLHYDPSKDGQKFEYEPPEPVSKTKEPLGIFSPAANDFQEEV